VLVKADYSQIELRIAAELTGDRRMREAYQRGDDLHAVTAAAVLGRLNNDVRPEDRQAAKALNFGLLFGMGPLGLREHALQNYGIVLSETEARRIRARFLAAYTGLRAWHRRQRDGVVETRTLLGRRRLGVKPFTQKLNSPIQGTGADGLKAALGLLWERRDCCPSAMPVLCVHDEVVLECNAGDVEGARKYLVDAMVDGMRQVLHEVPVVVDSTVGHDWSMRD
jgi:DNA polymerase-1